MDPELEEFHKTWVEEGIAIKSGAQDHTPGEKRPRSHELAKAYVAAHPDDETLAFCKQFNTIPSLVHMVDLARESGDEAARIKVDMWLLVNHDPQFIGGNFS